MENTIDFSTKLSKRNNTSFVLPIPSKVRKANPNVKFVNRAKVDVSLKINDSQTEAPKNDVAQ